MKKYFIFIFLLIISFLSQVSASQKDIKAGTILNYKINGIEISLIHGDILNIQVDAIVNAANKNLEHGGGICHVIHQAAGKELEKECLMYPLLADNTRCYTGHAVITKGYNLKNSKYVIHAVGPDWRVSNTNFASNLLSSAYQHSLELADKNKLNSIAFPAIGVGIFAFPPKKATQIAVETVLKFDYSKSTIKKIFFVIYNDQNLFDFYKQALEKYYEKDTKRFPNISKL